MLELVVLMLMLGHCGLNVVSFEASMASSLASIASSLASTDGGILVVVIPDNLGFELMVAVGHMGRIVVVWAVVGVIAEVVGQIGLVVVVVVVVVVVEVVVSVESFE